MIQNWFNVQARDGPLYQTLNNGWMDLSCLRGSTQKSRRTAIYNIPEEASTLVEMSNEWPHAIRKQV